MKRKWQRALSWILTLTMLFGTFGDAGFKVFAADNDDVAIETEDVSDDAAASEDDAQAEDEAVVTDGTSEEDPVDPEEGDDEYTDDVKIFFWNPGATYDKNPEEPEEADGLEDGAPFYSTQTHVRVLDGESRNADYAFHSVDSYENNAGADTAMKKWDSAQPYVFTLEAQPGYIFDTTLAALDAKQVEMYYVTSYSVNYKTEAVQSIAAKLGNDYTLEVSSDKQSARVTIDKGYMQKMRDTLNPAGDSNKNAAVVVKVKETVKEDNPLTTNVNEMQGVQPDTYYVTIADTYPATAVTEEERLATFDANMAEWAMKNKQLPKRPITGVRVYYVDASGKEVNLLSGTGYTWNPETYKFQILKSGVNEGYLKGNKNLIVEFKSEAYAINQTNLNVGKDLKFELGKSNANGTSGEAVTGVAKAWADAPNGDGYNNAEGILATYEVPTEYQDSRDLGSITVTIKGKSTTFLTGERGSQNRENNKSVERQSVWIPVKYNDTDKYNSQVQYINGDMDVSANTCETVTWQRRDTIYDVEVIPKADMGERLVDLGTEADLTDPVKYSILSDRDFTFRVNMKKTKKLASVQYKQGTTITECENNVDGTFTIPAAAMNKATEIIVNTATDTENPLLHVRMSVENEYATEPFIAPQQATLANIDARDAKYGIDLTQFTDDAKKGMLAMGANDDSFYFTVGVKNDSPFVIKSVSWRKQGSSDDYTELGLQNVGTNLYMLANPRADIEIKVKVNYLVNVTMPSNTEAIVTIGAKDYTHDVVVPYEYHKELQFSVKTTDANTISVTEVSYKVGNAARVEASKVDGTLYKISEDEMSGNVKIYVQTLESVVDGTKYYVDFWNYQGNIFNASTAPNNKDNSEYEYTDKHYGEVNWRVKEDGHYVFRINQYTEATLSPEIREVSALFNNGAGAIASGANLDTNPIKDDVKDTLKTRFWVDNSSYVKVEQDDVTRYNAKLIAEEQGDELMNYVVTQATHNANKDENLIQVTGALKIRVTPHFVVSIELVAPTDPLDKEWLDTVHTRVKATVLNGALTQASHIESIGSSENNVISYMTAGPTVAKNILWSSSKGKVSVDPDGDAQNSQLDVIDVPSDAIKTDIWASGEEDSPFKLKLTIVDEYQGKEKEYVSNTLSLQPVEAKNYIIVPEVTVADGGHFFGAEAMKIISIGAKDLNKAKVSFNVYEGNNTKGQYRTEFANIDTESKLEDALNQPMGDDKIWARKVESGVTWSYKLVDVPYPIRTVDWVSVEGADGVYDVTALRKSDDLTALVVKAVIGGINKSTKVLFDVCDTTELITININKLNDEEQKEYIGATARVKRQALGDAYINYWRSLTNAKYDDVYTANGYQFKIVNGSQFTLPTEDDFDQSVYTDKTRMLAGWKVGRSAGSNIAVVDGEIEKFYAPGETIAILDTDDTYTDRKGSLEVTPVWVYRYALSAQGFFINNGQTIEASHYSMDGKTETKVTVNDPTIKLTVNNNNNKISKNGGTVIGAAVYQNTNSTAETNWNTINQDNWAGIRGNILTPEAGTISGTVQWHSYDRYKANGADNRVTELITKLKNGYELTAEEQSSLALNTVLDQDELAKGILKGAKVGSAILYATYIDENDNVYYINDDPIEVTVVDPLQDPQITVDISKIALQNNVKDGIEVGQDVPVAADSIVVKEAGTAIGVNANIEGTFKWEIEPSDAVEIIKNEAGFYTGNPKTYKNGYELQPTIRGLKKADTVTMKLTYTNKNGLSGTSSPITIKITDPSYTIAFTDKDGKALSENTAIEAQVFTGNTEKEVGSFYVTATDKNGTKTTIGNWNFELTDVDLISETGFIKNTSFSTPTSQEVRKVSIKASNNKPVKIGNGTITATYTSADGKVYRATSPIKTYYGVNFGGGNSAQLGGQNAAQLVYGTVGVNTQFGDATKLKITNNAGTVLSDAETGLYVKKVYKEDLTYKNGKGFILELDDLKAIYSGTDKDKIAFAGWSDIISNPAQKRNALKTKLVINDASLWDNQIIRVYAYFGNLPAQSITASRTEFILDNAGVEGKSDNYKADAVNLIISVGPKTSPDKVLIKTDNDGFFNYLNGAFKRNDNGTLNNDGLTVAPASTAVPYEVKDANSKKTMKDSDTTQDYVVALTTIDKEHAGKATVTVYTAGSDLSASFNLIVKGIYKVDGKIHYMTETGEDLKDSCVTVGYDTYYFDAEGNQITNGIAKNADGKMVILKDGELQYGYVTNGDGKGHNFYTDEKTGVVMTGRFTTKDGKNYYADPENGWLVTDTFVTDGGKLYYYTATSEMAVGDGVKFTLITSQMDGVWKGSFEYQIAADGVITTNKLVDVEGGQVFVNSYGQKVTVAMATDGKYKDPVTGAEYDIDKDGFAKLAKIFYFTGYVEGEWAWNDGAPTVEVTMKYAADDGDDTPTEKLVLLATTEDGDDVAFKTYTATTVAKYTRKGVSTNEVVTLTKQFDRNGKSGVYSYKSHKFEWSASINKVTQLPDVTATVTYTISQNGVTVSEDTIETAVSVKKLDESTAVQVNFEASLVTIDGLIKSEQKAYDPATGFVIGHDGEHNWGKPEWDWTGTTSKNGVAKATFTCTVGNASHSVTIPADVTEEKRTEKIVVYKGTVSGPDANRYESTYTYDIASGGGKVGGTEGIGIEGLEDVYPYTGAAIKPAFIVVDYDRDVQLAQGTDYTVKYKNNKKVGTATITIKGKGNYQGEGVTATFEIKAPAEFCGLEADQLVAGVKKIAKIDFKPVYTGEAQYPETLSVTAKDKSVITLTHEGDGVYTTEGEKTVAITITNNVNKGTATVAATGADGKTKKKSFKITAAQLPTEGYEAAAAVFAVKGAKPAVITGEFNGKTIVLGQDFTIKKANNNKAAGEGNVIIKGKGNFAPKSTATVNFEIAPIELNDDNVAFNAVPKAKVSSKLVTIGDGNGAKIPAKMITVEGASGKLAAGQEIEVTIKGDGTNITGEVTKTIKVGAAKKAKATVQKNYSVEWTGELINLEELENNPFENSTISLKGLTYGEDYVVAGYLYSNKKGKMGVVLQGISEKFTGVTVAKVKVAAKTMKKAEQ